MTRRGTTVVVGLAMLYLGFFGLAGSASATSPLSADPPSYDFGTLTVGESYDFINDYVTVSNPGPDPVTISSIHLAGTDAGEFGIGELSNCIVDLVLNPDDFCFVDLAYTPTDAGPSLASVVVTPEAGDPLSIPVEGSASALAANAPSFDAATRSPQVDGEVANLTPGDVDGDGIDDVLASLFNAGNDLAVFPASADTTLGVPDLYPVSGGFPGNVKTGYINDDAYLDAVSSASGVARVFLNDGFGDMVFSADLGTETAEAMQTVGDFNDDGFEDVVVSNEYEVEVGEFRGFLSFYPGDGEGGFGSAIDTQVDDRSLFGMVTSDFDGDGKDDLAYTTYDRGRPVMMRSDGDGTFTRATVIGGNDCGCGRPEGIASSDLNSDGRDDITITLRFSNAVEVYLSKADGTFERSQLIRLPLTADGFDTNPKGIASSDLNGDGIPDAVTADYLSGTVSFFTGVGDGTYAYAGTRVLDGAGGPNAAAIGQFGSGVKPDVSIGDQGSFAEGGSVFTLRNNGNPGQVPVPSSLTFGETPSGYTSDPLTVELTNDEGIAPLIVEQAEIANGSSADFSIADASDCTDAPTLVGQSCSIEIVFEPVGPPGERDSTLFLNTNNEDITQVIVPLSGMAASDLPTGVVDPASVEFGQVTVGTAGPARSFTITNDGFVPLDTETTSIEGPDAAEFTASEGCSDKTLQVDQSCTVNLGFTPSAVGARSASVKVTSEFEDFVVPVSGNGVPAPAAGISVQPVSLTFANTRVGSVSTAQSVTVTSTGTAPLSVTGLALAGANPDNFRIASNGCTVTVQPGASCAVSLQFAPTANLVRGAALNITSNAGGEAVSVPLNGTGIPRPTPKVTFKKRPRQKIVIRTRTLRQVKVAFRSSLNGSRFQCRIDRRKFSGCKSPRIFRNIKPGKHTIRVRAIKAGKTGPAKAVSFRVIRKR